MPVALPDNALKIALLDKNENLAFSKSLNWQLAFPRKEPADICHRVRQEVRRMAGLFHRLKRKLLPPAGKLEGYENDELVDVVFRKTLAYDPPKEDWPDVLGTSTVLDFGGACGAHYKEAVLHTPDVRWAVVETAAMVRRASELANERLRFFVSVVEAADWLGSIDLMHSSGVLQYVPNPEATVAELCALGAKRMQWRRLLLTQGATIRETQTSFLTDNGPGTIEGLQEKSVEYGRTKMPERTFLHAHSDHYRLVDRGADWFRFELKGSTKLSERSASTADA